MLLLSIISVDDGVGAAVVVLNFLKKTHNYIFDRENQTYCFTWNLKKYAFKPHLVRYKNHILDLIFSWLCSQKLNNQLNIGQKIKWNMYSISNPDT